LRGARVVCIHREPAQRADCVEKPRNWPRPENRFWRWICWARQQVAAQRGYEAPQLATDAAGRVPSQNFSGRLSGLASCDRSENPSFSTQSAQSLRPRRGRRMRTNGASFSFRNRQISAVIAIRGIPRGAAPTAPRNPPPSDLRSMRSRMGLTQDVNRSGRPPKRRERQPLRPAAPRAPARTAQAGRARPERGATPNRPARPQASPASARGRGSGRIRG